MVIIPPIILLSKFHFFDYLNLLSLQNQFKPYLLNEAIPKAELMLRKRMGLGMCLWESSL